MTDKEKIKELQQEIKRLRKGLERIKGCAQDYDKWPKIGGGENIVGWCEGILSGKYKIDEL